MPKNKTKNELQIELEAAQKRVTELEETLKNSQGKQDFASVFRASPSQMALTTARMGTWSYHLPTNQFKWSRETSLLFQVDNFEDDLPAVIEHIHPDDRAEVSAALQKALSSGWISNLEFRMVDNKGDIFWVINYGGVEYDGSGKPLMISGLIQDITDRKKLADNLFKSEERYRIISDTVTDYAFSTHVKENGEFVMDWVSGAFETITGYTFDEFVACGGWRARLHPDDQLVDDEARKKLLSNCKSVSEVRIFHKDGREVYLRVFAQPLWDQKENRLKAIYGAVQDFTERKRLAQALEGEAVRRRVLFEESPEGILVIDASTAAFLEFNNKAAEQLGYTREEFSKLHIFDVEAQETAEETRAHIANVVKNGRSDFETLQRTKQGEIRNVHVTAMMVNIHGTHVYYCIWRDITERRRAEEARRESDERYQLLFEEMTQGVIFQDGEGRLLHANPAAEKILGVTQEKMLGQTSVDPNWPTIREDGSALPAEEHIAVRVLGSGQPVSDMIIGVFNPKKQTYIWLNVNAFPRFKDGDPRPHQVFTVFDDITDRKQAEMALRDSEKRLRAMLEVSQAMSAPLEMEVILQKIVENATGLLKLDSGAIYTLKGEELFLEATTPPLPPEFPDELRHASVADHSHIQAAISSGSIVILPDSKATELSDAERIVAESRGLRSIAYIPLIISEKAIGVLIVASVNRLRTFSADEITMYTGFSGQAAQTIENVRLYKAEHEYAVELESQIAERKQAEATLRESERKYRELINGMNDTVWVIDTDMSILDVNDAAVNTLGYSREELLSMKVSDIDSAIPSEQILQLIDRLSVEKLLMFEARHKTKDGREIPVEVSGSLISYMGRRVIMSIARDITDRKRAEEDIRVAEMRYRALIENAPDGIALISAEGSFIYLSPSGEKLTGYTGLEIQKQDPNAMTHPDDLPMLLGELEKVIRVPSYIPTIHYRFQKKSGEWRWVEGIFSNLLGVSGVDAIILNFRDITERKETEEKLNRNKALLAEAQRVGHIGHMEWSGRDQDLIGSDELFDILNLPHGSKLSQGAIASIMKPGERERIHALDVLAIQQNKDMEYEYCIQLPDGQERWLHQLNKVTYDEGGKMTRMLGVVQDVTERKQAEESLRKNEERLRTVADFTYDMEFWLDENKTLQYVSPSSQRITGYDREQFLKDPSLMQSIVHPEDQPVFGHHSANEFDLPGSHSMDFRIITSAGEVRWINHTCQAVTGTDGTFHGRRISHRDVTEQKRVLKELRDSEEKYRGLLESLDTVVANVDLNGRFLYMNDTAAGQLGSVPAQLFGKTMYELFPERVAQIQMGNIKSVAEADKGMTIENPSVVNGKPRWYRTSIQPLHDENGSVVSVLINSTDIHELKTMQQELQELNRTLEEKVVQRTAEVQDLYENAPTGYHSINAEGKFVMVNQTELNWLGYSSEEMIGHFASDFMTAATRNVFQKNFPLLFERGWVKDVEFEFVRKDGSVLPVLLNATSIYDEAGNFLLTRSTIFDNTERKQAENELKRNINFTTALLNAVPTPVFYKDKEGRYLGCNYAFVDLMGKTPEEIHGKLPHEVWSAPQADLYRQKDLDLMRSNERQFYEAVVTDKDGAVRPVIFVKDLFYDEGGNVAGLVGAFIDISERKASEEALQNINKELEYALRVKDEFLANMSHELRTPLNGILGFSEILLSGDFGALNERQLKYIGSIESSGKHLLGLINDLLDLSKIQAGKFELYPESVIISDLCQSSLVFVKQMALNKSIHLSFEDEVTFPFLIGDQRRLKQILVNLLSNAVKFTPNNGTVILRAQSDLLNNCIKFSVEDNGIGISPEDLQRLFMPFTQADNSLTRQHEGTGLGLTLVQKLAELHGGGITVQSEVGKGSTFTVSIPETHEVEIEEKKMQPLAPGGIGTRINKKPGAKILLAEDIDSNIMILGDYLEGKAYHMIYARNGEEALEKAKAALPDLILMDIQMPVLDGLEATRRLRADPRFASVPIIALTALAMRGDRERCLEAGATEYISKPVNLKQLIEMINHLLENK